MPPNDNVFKSRRYSADFSGFDGRDLAPQGYVEDWLVGDYDVNDILDADDLESLCSGWTTQDRVYDLNFDDLVDLADVAQMVTAPLVQAPVTVTGTSGTVVTQSTSPVTTR